MKGRFTNQSILVLLLFCMHLLGFAQQPKPVNKQASKEVDELLSEFYKLRGQHVLSGQHNYSYPSAYQRSTDSIISFTGQNPVIWGGDMGGERWRKQTIEKAIENFNNGHIITLMWHADCPVDTIPKKMNPVRYKISEREWNALMTEGSDLHQKWIEDIDEVATYLKILDQKNIPVLWRPYHEMNGIWFWWGNQPGPNGYQKLWKMMYDRYTNHHKLNNLIWVWNANGPRDWKDDEAYAYDLFFPGLGYVDVLATDIYKKDYKQSHHDDLLKLAGEKLIALGEIGAAPEPVILDQQTQWSWFMMWANWPWKYNTPATLNGLYNHPTVLNLDEYKALRP